MSKYLQDRLGRDGILGRVNRNQERAVPLENAEYVGVALQR